MKFVEALLTVAVTVGVVLSGSSCRAWEEPEERAGIVEQTQPFDDEPESLPEGTWEQRPQGFENADYEAPLTFYRPRLLDSPPPILHSPRLSTAGRSTWRGYPSDEVKQKRYMGMEIPEYISKSEGSVDAGGIPGGTPQRGMKQKLLNSG